MFSKKSVEHPNPATGSFADSPVPANPATNPERDRMTSRPTTSSSSVLGSDLSLKGDIRASADLQIDGNVEGDITCTTLVQGDTSTITGGIKAESARLAGTVNGSIAARELVVLRSAKITGDVFYDALTIEQGAQVEGRFAHRGSRSAAGGAGKPAADKPQQAGQSSAQSGQSPSGKPELSVAN